LIIKELPGNCRRYLEKSVLDLGGMSRVHSSNHQNAKASERGRKKSMPEFQLAGLDDLDKVSAPSVFKDSL